ncbi:MAG: DNA repair ATPase, partial [Enterobacteriaceae bacterium]
MSDTEESLQQQLDHAVAEGGAYETLRNRLNTQGERLQQLTDQLNQQRLQEFGSSQLATLARIRIRTENNCLARDIVQVGDLLLFGYNVFLGLKRETAVSDVFSLYRLVDQPVDQQQRDAEPVPLAGTFLDQPRFLQDFNELYTYYKSARLTQLLVKESTLLACFQIGNKLSDIRVFRWSLSSDREQITYIDNRGEKEIALPPQYDFEWQRATRDQIVPGAHPHINILDQVFVETINGDLTLKIENNTEDGLGIYREEVLDKDQSLNDALFDYAQLGSLILLKILPYREEQWRYLVYNSLTHQ